MEGVVERFDVVVEPKNVSECRQYNFLLYLYLTLPSGTEYWHSKYKMLMGPKNVRMVKWNRKK